MQIVPGSSHAVIRTLLYKLRSYSTFVLGSTGLQMSMVIQSGCEKHRLRRFHQAVANIKYFTNPIRAEALASSEQVGHCLEPPYRQSIIQLFPDDR
jgi:hypothetical protein